MKIIVLTLLALFFLFFFSCNSEKKKQADNPEISKVENAEPIDDEKDTEVETVKLDLTTTEGVLSAYLRQRAEFKKKLQSCTPQYANQLYLEYRKKVQVSTDQITSLESKMLDDYEGLYGDDGWLKLSGKYGAKIKNYQANGFEIWYVGEGMTEIRVRPSEISSMFLGRVTNDFQEFIELEEFDNRELITNDGGLSISLDRFSSIVRMWESFLQRNPKSALKKEAKETYSIYQIWYLLGLDNTPVVEHTDGMIYSENKENFKRYLDYYPKSPTSKLIKLLFELEGDYEEMSEEIGKAQRKSLQKI